MYTAYITYKYIGVLSRDDETWDVGYVGRGVGPRNILLLQSDNLQKSTKKALRNLFLTLKKKF